MTDYAETMHKLLSLSRRPAAMLSSLNVDGARMTGDAEINDIVDDSREVKPGNAFLCMPRACEWVDAYAADAARAGASAIISVGCRLEDPPLPVLYLKNIAMAGRVLRQWFDAESTPPLIGVTGTDGKTSCVWMLREALERFAGNAWSVGTLGWMRCRDLILPLPNTTPSLLIMHRLLAAAAAGGASALVCEVSSHGIKQGRIAGLPFTAALWTNLSNDHLQDFGGFSGYADCKAGFISGLAGDDRIVAANADDAELNRRIPAGTLGYGRGLDRRDVKLGWQQNAAGELMLRQAGRDVCIRDIPAGDFHAENLAAVGLMLSRVFAAPHERLPQLLSHMSTPPGRMQAVEAGSLRVFIDFAHTPEALERCLQSARAMTSGQLLLVFGCGGERSREKRPLMGEVAASLADIVWVTSDNPRGEEPSLIAAEIVHGMPRPCRARLRLQLDRGQAIAEAIAELGIGDLLIIAGKGHEDEMIVGERRLPWNDYDAAARLLHEKDHSDTRACA
ncbi:MAG: UDP-N-acetylmuramyl-tripeptide synthetase [Mariprofundaceae bacterium]